MKLVVVAGILVGACGGGHAGDAPDARLPDGGADAGPGACAGQSLAAIPLVGIYHADLTLEGTETAASFRIDQGAVGLTVVLGSELSYGVMPTPLTVGRTLDATDGTSGKTLSIDTLDDDCTMHGTWTVCVNGGCYPYQLTAMRTDRIDEPTARGMTELSEFAGNPGDSWITNGIPVNVRVSDGLAYLSNYWDGLRIVDVHDPAHPAELGHLLPEYPDQGEIYNDVKIVTAQSHTYALMASDVAGTVVVDATAPSAPAIVAHFGTPPGQNQPINVHTIFLDGGKAYLANIDTGLEIWDLADPVHPTKLGQWTQPTNGQYDIFPHDLYVSGARAYVNWWAAGLEILDVSNPASVQHVGTFAGYGQKTSHSNWVTQIDGRTVAIHGDEQWDSHVHVVDVTEGAPTFATSIGEWKTRPQVSAHNIMAFGSRVFMTYYQDGVRVLDLSDPTHPTPVAWFDTWPGHSPDYGTSFFEGAVGLDVDLANHLVYVADTRRGLIVLHLDV